MDARMHSRGLTLPEILFAVALLTLLASLALPSYRSAQRAGAVRASTFTVLAGLQHLRTQAILQARTGSFCAADGSGACVPSSAAGVGWRSSLEGAGLPPPGEAPGAEDAGPDATMHRPLPSGVVVRSTRSPIRFWPGSFSASAGTLTICDVHRIAAPRAIVISQTGRARLADAPWSACS